MMITSKANGQLKKVRKLLSSAKERKETGLFVVEGTRLFSEAPAELLEAVFVSEEFKITEFYKMPQDSMTSMDCKMALNRIQNAEVVEKEIFKGLSDTVNPQGVLAVVRQPKWSVTEILDKITELKKNIDSENWKEAEAVLSGKTEAGQAVKILMLDGVKDPGNLGTIIRTSEAAGVSMVAMSPECVDLFNPKVVRSTMGSIFRVPVVSAELLPMINELKGRGFDVYGTSLQAVKKYNEVNYSKAAIVIGSEATGITPEVAAATTENVIIPMTGQVESLNAAISAAIMLFAGK